MHLTLAQAAARLRPSRFELGPGGQINQALMRKVVTLETPKGNKLQVSRLLYVLCIMNERPGALRAPLTAPLFGTACCASDGAIIFSDLWQTRVLRLVCDKCGRACRRYRLNRIEGCLCVRC